MVDHVDRDRNARTGDDADRGGASEMGAFTRQVLKSGGYDVRLPRDRDRVSHFRVSDIRREITDGPIWMAYGQAVADYAIALLEGALRDAEAELEQARCQVIIAQGHVAGVQALIEEASGHGATRRTDDALMAQLRNSVSGRGHGMPKQRGGESPFKYGAYHDFQEDQGIAPDVCVCGAEKDAPLHMTPGKVLGSG